MKAGGVGGAMVMDENGDVEGDSITISTASSSGGEVGRGGEAEQEGLPVLLLRELASFKARFPSRVGKHLRSDAAEMVLKTQVCQNQLVGGMFCRCLAGFEAVWDIFVEWRGT